MILFAFSCKSGKVSGSGSGSGEKKPETPPVIEKPAPPPAPPPMPPPTPPIPGVDAIKVGINHEDKPSFPDFDDAVLCLYARSKVLGQSIVSSEDQKNIVVAVTSKSDYTHKLVVKIIASDGSLRQSISHTTVFHGSNQFIIPEFKKGDKIESTIIQLFPSQLVVNFSSNDPNMTHVIPNQCNTGS